MLIRMRDHGKQRRLDRKNDLVGSSNIRLRIRDHGAIGASPQNRARVRGLWVTTLLRWLLFFTFRFFSNFVLISKRLLQIFRARDRPFENFDPCSLDGACLDSNDSVRSESESAQAPYPLRFFA